MRGGRNSGVVWGRGNAVVGREEGERGPGGQRGRCDRRGVRRGGWRDRVSDPERRGGCEGWRGRVKSMGGGGEEWGGRDIGGEGRGGR